MIELETDNLYSVVVVVAVRKKSHKMLHSQYPQKAISFATSIMRILSIYQLLNNSHASKLPSLLSWSSNDIDILILNIASFKVNETNYWLLIISSLGNFSLNFYCAAIQSQAKVNIKSEISQSREDDSVDRDEKLKM